MSGVNDVLKKAHSWDYTCHFLYLAKPKLYCLSTIQQCEDIKKLNCDICLFVKHGNIEMIYYKLFCARIFMCITTL